MVKVLICNTLENKGGAARATSRIVECLQKTDIVIEKLHLFKNSQEKKSLIPKIDAIPKLLCSKRRSTPFASSLISFGARKTVKKHNPDILHLNYINMGLFSIKDIGGFKMPIVWTLHDSWAFTGGCHLPNECTKYTSRCEQCPALGSKRNYDLSTYIFSQKTKHWENLNLTIVCPSKWMGEKVKKSKLLEKYNIHVIPNPLNTDIFNPKDKQEALNKYGLDKNKKHILFGSINPLEDKNKGFEFLQKALDSLNLKNTELLILGSEKKEIKVKIPTRFLGYIESESDLAHIYSIADLTVLTSISENLPNVLIESLACGTPCVAFNVGGVPEIITKEDFGLLVEKSDVKELALAIKKVLEKKNLNRSLLHKETKEKYGYETISQKYEEIYKSLAF